MTKPRKATPEELERLAELTHVNRPKGEGWEATTETGHLMWRRPKGDGTYEYVNPQDYDDTAR